MQIVRFLIKRESVKGVVVACNTSSAWALKDLHKAFDIPILGVIRPGASAAVEVTRNGRIGVIGTEGTISSGVYPNTIHELMPRPRFSPKPARFSCPWSRKEAFWPCRGVGGQEYLKPLLKSGIDTLLLGCTHYHY